MHSKQIRSSSPLTRSLALSAGAGSLCFLATELAQAQTVGRAAPLSTGRGSVRQIMNGSVRSLFTQAAVPENLVPENPALALPPDLALPPAAQPPAQGT